MRLIIIISITVAALMLASCSPDLFTLNKRNNQYIGGLIMSDLDDVDIINDNSLMLYDGGAVAMGRSELTNLTADFTVDVMKGEGLRFAIRSVSDHFDKQPAIYFDYSTEGSSVIEKGKEKILLHNIKAKINQPTRIIFKNDCSYYSIIVDCDTVYTGRTWLPNTEYVIIKTLPKSDVLLSGISITHTIVENE
jgi:hypothetical protein